MSLLESVLYGLISGITEFLPVSSRAHQALMRYLFGAGAGNPLQELFIHIGVGLSVFVSCRELIAGLRRERRLPRAVKRKSWHPMDGKSRYDKLLLTTATVSLIIFLLLGLSAQKLQQNLLAVAGFLFVNALILLVAEHSRHGNRDSRMMSKLDGIVLGAAGALSSLPGVSRTGTAAAYGTLRGADSESVMNWAVLLAIPAMCFMAGYEIVLMFMGTVGTLSVLLLLSCLLSGAAAFCGGLLGIAVLRQIMLNSGLSGFSYYSIGTALFTLVLYLIT